MKSKAKVLSLVLSAVMLASCSVSESKSDSSKSADSSSASSAGSTDYKYGKIDIPGRDGALCGAPIYIAYENGYFAEEGFDVNLISADFETRKIGLNNGSIPIVNGDFQFFPSIENGIDVVRIFDALNDVRNMEQAMRSVKKYGAICEAALSYTTSPVHDNDYFVNLAATLEGMGADVICIKDMANLLLPDNARILIKKIKKRVKVPIHLHTHNTTGTGQMIYMMATLAGVNIIDCALSPFANGTSQPATEAMVAGFMGTSRDTKLDLQLLNKASSHFAKVARRMQEEGLLNPKVLQLDPNTLFYQVPGGMLSNLMIQLKTANAEDRFEEVLKEVPVVRKDFGYPPLVTPTSQIVGTQAVLNVLSGRRYSTFTNESKMLLRGEYGRLPGEVNEEVRRMAIGTEAIMEERPADHLSPEIEAARRKYDFAETEEDLLSSILFPQIAEEFLKKRKQNDVHEIEVVWNR